MIDVKKYENFKFPRFEKNVLGDPRYSIVEYNDPQVCSWNLFEVLQGNKTCLLLYEDKYYYPQCLFGQSFLEHYCGKDLQPTTVNMRNLFGLFKTIRDSGTLQNYKDSDKYTIQNSNYARLKKLLLSNTNSINIKMINGEYSDPQFYRTLVTKDSKPIFRTIPINDENYRNQLYFLDNNSEYFNETFSEVDWDIIKQRDKIFMPLIYSQTVSLAYLLRKMYWAQKTKN